MQHGKRADAIVKNMLLHSRPGSGEHRPTAGCLTGAGAALGCRDGGLGGGFEPNEPLPSTSKAPGLQTDARNWVSQPPTPEFGYVFSVGDACNVLFIDEPARRIFS